MQYNVSGRAEYVNMQYSNSYRKRKGKLNLFVGQNIGLICITTAVALYVCTLGDFTFLFE